MNSIKITVSDSGSNFCCLIEGNRKCAFELFGTSESYLFNKKIEMQVILYQLKVLIEAE